MPDPRYVPMDDQTSKRMRAVAQARTRPERRVAAALDALGIAYEAQASELPGRPDFALDALRTVVFVHGCFWHDHAGCKRATKPRHNADLWRAKLAATVRRDQATRAALEEDGWQVETIWECETRDAAALATRLAALR